MVDKTALVAFLNTTDDPITVPEGTLYGTLTPANNGEGAIYSLSQAPAEKDKLSAWQKGTTTKDSVPTFGRNSSWTRAPW